MAATTTDNGFGEKLGEIKTMENLRNRREYLRFDVIRHHPALLTSFRIRALKCNRLDKMVKWLISKASLSIPATMVFAVTFQAFFVPTQCSSFEEAPRDDSNPKSLAYDVASVKVHSRESGGSMGSSYFPDGFSCNDLTLENLIIIAYGVNEQTISGGPRWIDETGFDIQAKISEDELDKFKTLQHRERDALLKAILADRFKLKVHYATKYQQLYELTADKGGSKLKKAEPPKNSDRDMTMYSSGRYKGNRVTMKMLTDILAFTLHSNIVDGTNLDDAYEVDLRWKPDTESHQGSEDDVISRPSIFTALREQLGLKLVSTRGPVQKLVIDYAELPSAN